MTPDALDARKRRLQKAVIAARGDVAWAVNDAAKPRPITEEVTRALARFEVAIREDERAKHVNAI